MGVSINGGIQKMVWLIMDNHINLDDLGVPPYFRKPPYDGQNPLGQMREVQEFHLFGVMASFLTHAEHWQFLVWLMIFDPSVVEWYSTLQKDLRNGP